MASPAIPAGASRNGVLSEPCPLIGESSVKDAGVLDGSDAEYSGNFTSAPLSTRSDLVGCNPAGIAVASPSNISKSKELKCPDVLWDLMGISCKVAVGGVVLAVISYCALKALGFTTVATVLSALSFSIGTFAGGIAVATFALIVFGITGIIWLGLRGW